MRSLCSRGIAIGTTALLTGVSTGLLVMPAHALTGPAAADGTYAFTAKIDIGDLDRSCSGALVAAQWVATSASCFAADPAHPEALKAGKPSKTTKATIGRTNLASTTGTVQSVVELVPYEGRDLVLARLARPVTNVSPVTVATTAPASGESLKAAGFGRTKTEWVTDKLHTGTFTAGTATDNTVDLAAADGSTICAGDTGGPLLREAGGKVELIGVNSLSWQGGCFGNTEETRTDAVAARIDTVADWVNTTVNAASVTDFNCDGDRDVAIADPDATVGGATKAGRVQVVYGGGAAPVEVSQGLASVPGTAEKNDHFGAALATYDANLDGCTDLVVGVPGEAVGTETGAGGVHIIYGSPLGLAQGTKTLNFTQGSGTGALASTSSEAGDAMGEALAAGTTTTGEPYLAIGVPGEDDTSGNTDAGAVFYLRGSSTVLINQSKDGVPGVVEKDDRFGASLAGSPQHLAIGAPGEAIGTLAKAGGVSIFTHTLNSAKIPTPIAGMDQNLDTVEGGAEAGDQFGASIALVPYRASATSTGSESILAIGSPGEDSTTMADAGRVDTFKLTANAFTQINGFHQDTAGVSGEMEGGDQFGATLSAVATEPGEISTAANLFLAVGVPGEDTGTNADTGTTYTFGLLGAPGDSDQSIYPGKFGVPGTPTAGEKVGNSLTATPGHLYLGIPDGPSAYGSAYAVPWAVIAGGTDDAVTSYIPGQNGLPGTGSRFGAALH
ncbi:trypsin-like serine protease [Streptomyces sp. NBC_01471]|uniref:trypsin-like serine protease n=1 Tax=Streptomyces sp. NBC_01471 TaxID=2903879 RepID=UPI0032467A61